MKREEKIYAEANKVKIILNYMAIKNDDAVAGTTHAMKLKFPDEVKAILGGDYIFSEISEQIYKIMDLERKYGKYKKGKVFFVSIY